MTPEAGATSPARTLRRLVFPAPLRPTSPTLSPSRSRKLPSRTTARAATSTVSSVAWSTAPGIVPAKIEFMCHPEVPAGAPVPDVERIEAEIPLVGRQEKMPALMARPRTGAGAGVLIVCDVYGRSPFYEDLAGRLALAGFTALVPEYFFREGPLAERTRELAFERRARLDQNQTLVDLEQAIDWLKLQPFAEG